MIKHTDKAKANGKGKKQMVESLLYSAFLAADK